MHCTHDCAVSTLDGTVICVRNALMQNTVTSAREEMGLSMAELAERLGVHRSTVNRWELGKPVPKPEGRLLDELLTKHRAKKAEEVRQ